jgi:RNA ligase (TIGR02306 family)
LPNNYNYNKDENLLLEGDDLTEYLGIQKWEAPVNAQLAGMSKGNFPHFIRKTDEERIQNIQKDIQMAFDNQDEFEVSLKVDGSSCTIYRNEDVFGVCSRNIDLKLDQVGNSFVDIAHNTGLLSALELLGRNLAVQGELMGVGIQGNRENLKEHQLYIFNIFDIDEQEYIEPVERCYVLQELINFGYTGKHVPVLETHFKLPTADIDELLKIAEGKSINHPIREGLVFKRRDGKFSFKIINNQFLVKEK